MLTALVIAGHEFNANYPTVVCNHCGRPLEAVMDRTSPEPCPKRTDIDAIWRAVRSSAGA